MFVCNLAVQATWLQKNITIPHIKEGEKEWRGRTEEQVERKVIIDNMVYWYFMWWLYFQIFLVFVLFCVDIEKITETCKSYKNEKTKVVMYWSNFYSISMLIISLTGLTKCVIVDRFIICDNLLFRFKTAWAHQSRDMVRWREGREGDMSGKIFIISWNLVITNCMQCFLYGPSGCN